ncbi:MAG: ABC-type Fe3+-hydroxamate transport system substrate-binding protein [Cognaticolwellia sp.]|jgi:ABC-type Fe3+-hydroxamate transport system substrate-binding protein
MIKQINNQLNNEIQYKISRNKIISIVPSQTEFLYDLGLEEEVVGITKFCIYPEHWFRSKTRIGGTKQLKIDVITELNPDLIIGNKEENERSQIEELQEKFPVWLSDIVTFEDALNMMRTIGKLVNREVKANQIVQQIIDKKKNFDLKFTSNKRLKVAYFIWRKPYMVAANDTYINEMLRTFGAENIFESKVRYPEIELQDLKKYDVDAIFLSSEPYPYKKKHLAEFQAACPNAKVVLVDGEAFSWYGSRMLKAFDYFEVLWGLIRN